MLHMLDGDPPDLHCRYLFLFNYVLDENVPKDLEILTRFTLTSLYYCWYLVNLVAVPILMRIYISEVTLLTMLRMREYQSRCHTRHW